MSTQAPVVTEPAAIDRAAPAAIDRAAPAAEMTAALARAFEPGQAELLAAAFEGLHAEIASLRGLLQEALARSNAISEEIPREHLVVLAAAVACVFGKRARVRSARRVPRGGAGAWAQQGRVFVQASHNLVHRR